MITSPPLFDIDPETRAAVDRAAADSGVSPQEWLQDMLKQHLRENGYLAPGDGASLRPEKLNANNDG